MGGGGEAEGLPPQQQHAAVHVEVPEMDEEEVH
jgi:hypothetical protein